MNIENLKISSETQSLNVGVDSKELPRSYQENIVDGLYKVDTSSKLEHLDNEFCRYYKATGLQDGLEYFAIVFLDNFIPPIEILYSLKSFHVNGLNKLLAYSIVKLSALNKTCLVAVVDKYEINDSLQNYVVHNGSLTMNQIETKLIPAIYNVLVFCQRYNISCGNINPENIIVGSNGSMMLREFFISYSGFYQQNAYLAPEIAISGASIHYALYLLFYY